MSSTAFSFRSVLFTPSPSPSPSPFAAPRAPTSGTRRTAAASPVLDVARDPFAAVEDEASLASEVAWFDAPPRRSSRPPRGLSFPPPALVSSSPPPPIDDPLADRWFR